MRLLLIALYKYPYLLTYLLNGCDVGIILLEQTILAPSIRLVHNATSQMLIYSEIQVFGTTVSLFISGSLVVLWSTLSM